MMTSYFNNLSIRKIHRYLGLFIGVQLLIWSISGMYFSWTDINEIHGDQFRNIPPISNSFENLISPTALEKQPEIKSIELREISNKPYYWINKKILYDAITGKIKKGISKQEALNIAARYMKSNLIVKDVQLITEVDQHSEYREKPLPAFVISYNNNESIKAYVSAKDGSFQSVRHRSWRWYDFFWMLHTMDYNTRDNFNTTLLRAFSLLGFITVFSGFALWYITSPTLRKLNGNLNNKKNNYEKLNN